MTACEEALQRAGRVAPTWLRAAWSEPLGVYSPEPRYEQNALKGFVDRLADMLARLCGAVLNRALVAQRLVAVVFEPWRVEGGEVCKAGRRIRLVLDNGRSIDVFVAIVYGPEGGVRGAVVESEELGCRGAWGQV